MNFFTHILSPLGGITLAGDEEALTGLWFDGQKYFPEQLSGEERETPVFRKVSDWLHQYFAGKNPATEIPIHVCGSQFRRDVWGILQQIPYGTTTTYGQIAKQLAARTGKNVSAQAVGGAVGHNPVSLIIPCHRVVGSDGSLTGYAGGIEKKYALLKLEGVDLSAFFLPCEDSEKNDKIKH